VRPFETIRWQLVQVRFGGNALNQNSPTFSLPISANIAFIVQLNTHINDSEERQKQDDPKKYT
jgi:hypothetical protein